MGKMVYLLVWVNQGCRARRSKGGDDKTKIAGVLGGSTLNGRPVV